MKTKKVLFVTLKTQIIIILGYTLFGSYAGANPLNTEEAKEDTTISMNQAPDMESDKAERNGFANVGLISSCSFDIDSFSDCVFNLHLSTDYGVVFGKSAIADAGILEGRVGINGHYSYFGGDSLYTIGVGFGIDINFIKNDGINKMIPGLFLGAGIAYNKPYKNDGQIIGSVATGALLKAFVSKQLALVPFLGVEYSRGHIISKDNQPVDLSSDNLNIHLGLGLRYYF